MSFFAGHQRSLILADSLTKNFFRMENTKVITQRGGTPEKAIEFIESQPKVVSEYKVIILHVGTNWLSRKEEWSLYRRKVNGSFSEYEYREALCRLNPPPAIGDAIRFRNTYQKFINLIRSLNSDAIILVSSIIPRWWDNDRRHGIRETCSGIKNLLL